MGTEVLERLRQNHDNVRSLRQAFAGQVAMVAREDEPDYGLMRELIACLLDDPERYHHPFERYLINRLRERRPESSELISRLSRRHASVARLGRWLQRRLDEIAVEVPVRRRGFVTFAHAYLRSHEAQLAQEEGELYPLLASSLEPTDWVEATTAFQWYRQPYESAHESVPHQDLRERVRNVAGDSLPPTETGFCRLCAAE